VSAATRDAALRVAVLSTLLDQVKSAHSEARAAAQPVFAEARKDGQTQQKVMLPDGSEIGLVSIRGATPAVDFTGGAAGLLAWCTEHAPHHVESYIVDGAAEMNDVIALVAEKFPNLVKRRVRASALAELSKQARETSGYVVTEDGEKFKLATVTSADPTGAFAYRPAAGAQDRIMREWQAGNLREIALGPIALPSHETAGAGDA
jgi:hypothetical protein